MTMIIDGKKISADIKAELALKTQRLIADRGIRPGLGLLLVGENPASQVYVRSKAKSCEELGYHSVTLTRPSDITEEEILAIVQTFNDDPLIHGILVQLPLPKHINEQNVLLAIDPRKDVDGFHPMNTGRLVAGLPCFAPCTPAGIMEMILRTGIETKGRHAVVVGRSNIVGKPIANMLYQKADGANAIVTIAHTATKDLSYYTKQADILVAAVGVPRVITADMVKEGVVVIDVGINRIEDPTAKSGSRLVGDVDYEGIFPKAKAITPVPGGVGPMTIAMLMHNTYRSAVGEISW
jgi:methylenetetrahydrofolate dehydrogenase (NADP+)/methenyltetrahydrofolate cyclohydrolase